MDQNNDEKLLNYLDGLMTDDQAKALKSQLEQSPAVRERLELLRSIHDTMKERTGLMQPSSNFTHRVMLNLHRLPVSTGLSPKNGLLLLGGILVAVGMLAFLLSGGVFDNMTDSISLNGLPVSKEIVKSPLPTVAVNGKWIINGIMVLALGLSFVLLDRTILRPLFNRRSRLQF